MKIIIANQKGGVGKTTHSILIANYLSMVKKQDIIVLDMDFQESITAMRNEDEDIHKDGFSYQVANVSLEEFSTITESLNKVGKGHIIIDLPGKVDDNDLVKVYQSADIVICPYTFDKLSFESTLIFSQILKHINKDVQILFLPNRVKNTVKYELKDQVNTVLKEHGDIMPEVPDRISLQRIDTISLNEDQISILKDSYDAISKYIIN